MTTPRYLIIGGTTKSATTSLFNYLADHPDICASNVKETRYFLEVEYPLSSKYRLEDGLDKYDTYFNQCRAETVRMEATPDYLYSSIAPKRIFSSLPEVHLIFILRNPIDRLISWYRFAKQTGRLSAEITFDEYVRLQRDEANWETPTQHMQALAHGRYSDYLQRYFEQFPSKRIGITQQETLAQRPREVLQAICRFVSIDPKPFDHYQVTIFNRTQAVKSVKLHQAYTRTIQHLRYYIHNKPSVRAVLRWCRRTIEPWYLRFNNSAEEQLSLGPPTRRFLEDYYRDETSKLAQLLNYPRFSWEAAGELLYFHRDQDSIIA